MRKIQYSPLFEILSRLEQIKILGEYPFEYFLRESKLEKKLLEIYLKNSFQLYRNAITDLSIDLNSLFAFNFPWLLITFTKLFTLGNEGEDENNLIKNLNLHALAVTSVRSKDYSNAKIVVIEKNFDISLSLLDFNLSLSEKILVKCEGDEEKSAQINLILMLLNDFEENVDFKNACINLIMLQLNDSNNTNLKRKYLKEIFTVMIENLSLLKKLTVQLNSHQKFIDSLTYLLSLIAKKLKYSQNDVLKLSRLNGFCSSLDLQPKLDFPKEIIELALLTKLNPNKDKPSKKMVCFFCVNKERRFSGSKISEANMAISTPNP